MPDEFSGEVFRPSLMRSASDSGGENGLLVEVTSGSLEDRVTDWKQLVDNELYKDPLSMFGLIADAPYDTHPKEVVDYVLSTILPAALDDATEIRWLDLNPDGADDRLLTVVVEHMERALAQHLRENPSEALRSEVKRLLFGVLDMYCKEDIRTREIDDMDVTAPGYIYRDQYVDNDFEIENGGYSLMQEMEDSWGVSARYILLFLADSKVSLTRDEVEQCIDIVKSFGPFATDCVARIFSNQENVGQIAHTALNALRETNNKAEKDFLSRTLYHLELGKVGIHDNVIEYLEKKFVLSREDAEKIEFAQRITVDGKIGVFDGSGGLVGYIEMGALDDKEMEQQVRILEVTHDLLFSRLEDPDGTLASIRKQFLADYKKFSDDVFQREVGGIGLNDCTLREAVWLYNYWAVDCNKETDGEKWQHAIRLKTEYGIEGVRVFIAGEQDSHIGDRVIQFTYNTEIDQSIKKQLLRQYSTIVQELDSVEQRVQEFFVKQDHQPVDVKAVTHEVATRAYRMLDKTLRLFEKGGDIHMLEDEIQDMRKDIAVFASIFKTLFKGKEHVDFEQIRGIDFERCDIEKLTEDEKAYMIKISKHNWGAQGGIGKKVVEELRNTLESGHGIDFHLVKKDGVPIAFVRFGPADTNGHREAASLNVDPDYRGSGIGEAVIHEAVNREAQKYILDGTVKPSLEIGTKWVEDTGFSIVGVLDNFKDAGEPFFAIECDVSRNDHMITRSMSAKELMMKLVQPDDVNANVVVFSGDPERDGDKLVGRVRELLAEGYIGTRYFTHITDQSQRVYVFEKNKNSEMSYTMAA